MKARKHRKNKAGAGRPKLYGTRIVLPLPDGILAAIDAALEPEEIRLDFIRNAIKRELKQRVRS
jgi:hypothetical protein